MRKKKVAVIGLGYVGLPAMVAIHRSNLYEVVGFDIDEDKINKIKSGIDPIGDRVVGEYLVNNELKVSSNKKDLSNSNIFIIAVPTPVYDDFNPNYEPIKNAVKLISKFLNKGGHVVLESTVNPGTSEEIILPIIEKESGLKAGTDFNIAHCPERINPGDKKWTLYNITRNIGSINKKLNKEIAEFYRSFLPGTTINEVSSLKIAESTKIVENTFRDINIAYVNELAQSFDAMGIDLYETLEAASNKPFGFMTHWPGCGVGGHCIAVDPYYLIKRAGLSGFDHKFLKIAREINNYMPEYTVRRLMDALNEIALPLKKSQVTLLGLSYKANVADLRESPSIKIIDQLLAKGAKVVAYDPFIKNKKHLNNKISLANDLSSSLDGSRALILATAHDEFKEDLPKILKGKKIKIIIDGRNCLDKKEIEKMGIIYKGIGK